MAFAALRFGGQMNESDKAAAANANESRNSTTLDIKTLLAEEDSDFISLHELLTVIAAAGNATYQEASRLLLRRLKNTDSDYRPTWYRLDINHGIVAMTNSDDSSSWECLRQAAKDGEPLESDHDEIPF
jgi:hypothetical protein